MPAPAIRDGQALWLLAATFAVAVAGLVYELIAGAVSSYLLGDSVTQFSLVIGIFMTSMGLGAWASRFVTRAERGFTLSQVLLGVVGGFSAPVLFLAYGWLDGMQAIPFTIVVLRGGDGMATREILRWPGLESVTLVDLNPRVTDLFRDTPELAALNGNSLSDTRVTIVNQDAWAFVRNETRLVDMIVLVLPDPRDFAVSKLYSREFHGPLIQRVAAGGAIVAKAGSPLFSRQAYWSIVRTLAETRNPQDPD